jgi:hypothetical protein
MRKQINIADLVMHESVARLSGEFRTDIECREFLKRAEADGMNVVYSDAPPRDQSPKPVNRYVYFVLCRDANRIKIGVTTSPSIRIETHQTSCPFPLETLCVVSGGYDLERTLHIRFSHLRRHLEWFEADLEIFEFITTLKNESDTI